MSERSLLFRDALHDQSTREGEEVAEEVESHGSTEELILTYDEGGEPLVPAEEQNVQLEPDESDVINAVVMDVAHLSTMAVDTRSIISLLPEEKDEEMKSGSLESPCLCKGTIGLVHIICLERWLTESRRFTCELCGFRYETVRVPRLSRFKAFIVWISGPVGKMMVLDMLKIVFLVPITILSTYYYGIYISNFMLVADRLLSCPFEMSLSRSLQFQDDKSNFNNSITWASFMTSIKGIFTWRPRGFKMNFAISKETLELLTEGLKTCAAFSTTLILVHISHTVIRSVLDHFDSWNRWWQADSMVRLLETPPEARRSRVVAEAAHREFSLF